MALTSAVEELTLLAAGWHSIGLRGAVVEWELGRPARLVAPLATRLRSALGPALAAGGVRSGTLLSIPGDSRPPAVWFLGWDCPRGPVLRARAELRCVGAVAGDWPELAAALARMRFPAAGRPGALADTVRCSVSWRGAERSLAAEFGPPLVDEPALDLPAGTCLVEAVTPLQLRADGREVVGPPPLEVLVRSAGERFRQLCLSWGTGAEVLPRVIGRAYREARGARLAWARAGRPVPVVRRSSSNGQVQVIGGVEGVFAYEEVTPLAMAVLALGAEVGVGKDTAFGCGQMRLYRGEAVR